MDYTGGPSTTSISNLLKSTIKGTSFNSLDCLDPNLGGHISLQSYGSPVGFQVDTRVGGQDLYLHARPDADAFEILQQFAVPFKDADHREALLAARLLQRLEATAAAGSRRIAAHHVTVRTSTARAEPFGELAFEIRRDGMFQLFGLVVDLVLLQPEDLREHALQEVVPVEQAVGDLAAGGGQGDLSGFGDANELIALQALDCHGYSRGGHL